MSVRDNRSTYEAELRSKPGSAGGFSLAGALASGRSPPAPLWRCLLGKVVRFAYVPLPFSTEKQLEAKGGPIHHLFYGRTLNLDTRIGAFHSKIKEEIPLTYQGQSPSKWTWEGILFMDWKHFHYSYSTRPFQMQKSSLSDIKCNCKTDLEIIYWRKKWGVTTVPDLLSFFYLESSQPFIWRQSQVNKF